MHTTEAEARRSYIIIPASARATLAHEITTGRSPATKMDKSHEDAMLISNITLYTKTKLETTFCMYKDKTTAKTCEMKSQTSLL